MLSIRTFLARASIVTLVTVAVGYSSDASAGAKIKVGEDKWLAVGLLMQPQFVISEGTVNERKNNQDKEVDGWQLDPMVKRTRIMVYGQFSKLVNFFMETDTPKFGLRQDFNVKTYVQDAYVELNFGEAFQIATGLLLPPFSHHGMQGATSLLGLEYHASVVKRPRGADSVWRDVGFMVRGLLVEKMLEYRVCVTNGIQRAPTGDTTADEADAINANDIPRVTARLTFNLFDAEGGAGPGGMFWDGLYLKEDGDKLISPKKVVSFGTSVSYQPKNHYEVPGTTTELQDWLGAALDAFVDIPLGDGTQSVNAQVNLYMYMLGDKDPDSGMAAMFEGGYRIGRIQPVVGIDWFDVKDADTKGDLLSFQLGLNYWIHGHSASFKAQVGAKKVDDPATKKDEKFEPFALIQTQIVF